MSPRRRDLNSIISFNSRPGRTKVLLYYLSRAAGRRPLAARAAGRTRAPRWWGAEGMAALRRVKAAPREERTAPPARPRDIIVIMIGAVSSANRDGLDICVVALQTFTDRLYEIQWSDFAHGRLLRTF